MNGDSGSAEDTVVRRIDSLCQETQWLCRPLDQIKKLMILLHLNFSFDRPPFAQPNHGYNIFVALGWELPAIIWMSPKFSLLHATVPKNPLARHRAQNCWFVDSVQSGVCICPVSKYNGEFSCFGRVQVSSATCTTWLYVFGELT